jgi:hypothetical protein
MMSVDAKVNFTYQTKIEQVKHNEDTLRIFRKGKPIWY